VELRHGPGTADERLDLLLPWFTERFAPVYNRRCAAYHGEAKGELGLADPRQWSWLNLTRPAWSPALNAHLAKSAGGRGIPTKGFLFQDTADTDYQAMLAAITEGGKKAYETPEADMPGFIRRSQNRSFVYQPVAAKLDSLAERR